MLGGEGGAAAGYGFRCAATKDGEPWGTEGGSRVRADINRGLWAPWGQ